MQWNLQQLAVLRADVAALTTQAPAGDQAHASDTDVELLLFGARLRTLRGDADEAVATTFPDSTTDVAEAMGQADAEAEAIELTLAEIWTDRIRNRAEPKAQPFRRAVDEWLAPNRDRIVHIGAGVAAIAILAVVAPLVPVLSNRLAPATPSAPPRLERAAVLGGQVQRQPPASSDPRVEPGATLVTFDEWRMTGPIAPGWRIERGSSEQVGVAALPSAVDRSLELSAMTTGEGATVCRVVPERARSIVFDALIETPGADLYLALPGDDPRVSEPEWLLTSDDGADRSAVAVVPVAVDSWYRFEAAVDPGQSVLSWRVLEPGRDSNGATVLAQGDVTPADAPVDVCLTVADGVPDARVFIDNVTIAPDG